MILGEKWFMFLGFCVSTVYALFDFIKMDKNVLDIS